MCMSRQRTEGQRRREESGHDRNQAVNQCKTPTSPAGLALGSRARSSRRPMADVGHASLAQRLDVPPDLRLAALEQPRGFANRGLLAVAGAARAPSLGARPVARLRGHQPPSRPHARGLGAARVAGAHDGWLYYIGCCIAYKRDGGGCCCCRARVASKGLALFQSLSGHFAASGRPV